MEDELQMRSAAGGATGLQGPAPSRILEMRVTLIQTRESAMQGGRRCHVHYSNTELITHSAISLQEILHAFMDQTSMLLRELQGQMAEWLAQTAQSPCGNIFAEEATLAKETRAAKHEHNVGGVNRDPWKRRTHLGEIHAAFFANAAEAMRNGISEGAGPEGQQMVPIGDVAPPR